MVMIHTESQWLPTMDMCNTSAPYENAPSDVKAANSQSQRGKRSVTEVENV